MGGENGLWAWDVTEWKDGNEGAGRCYSAKSGCRWVSFRSGFLALDGAIRRHLEDDLIAFHDSGQVQQCKWSSDGSMVAIAAEGSGVGVVKTADWTPLWQCWVDPHGKVPAPGKEFMRKVPALGACRVGAPAGVGGLRWLHGGRALETPPIAGRGHASR